MVTIGDIFLAKGDVEKAKAAYYEGLQSSTRQNNQADVANLNHRLFRIYLTEKNKDSVLSYAIKNLPVIKSVAGVGYRGIDIGVAYEDLYKAYQLTNQIENVYKYQSLALITKDSLYKVRIKNLADFQKLSLDEALRLENLEKERIKTQSNIRTYGMLSGITVLSVIGYILYRSNRQKHKTNMVLQEQKEKVENALSQLKSTQSQLIQSEKMASLGELTAGIAHEIQNPLNFVNNFSEVNLDLIRDLKSEIRNNNLEEVNLLTNDIESNSEKVNHHGKRAADIVKGMLQHSRTSSGQKELTDINALADEYLRLAYHGLRAKDKSFNAKFETHLDPSLPKLNVIPQDIGRVLLNLINNAFYAVSEKSSYAKASEDTYEPTVTVTTRKLSDIIEISVMDNGNGIPDSIKKKIFQPFFTTKPTGQGTGLGLSLSYDIMKAHGGVLSVETKEGEGSIFFIQLPMK
ncbi:MAG: GHKL domain-containing protein [Cyclobacteriaceae bacterium]|nr:GHKL domain-containing protein [Cyclobacteriaceae bacterium]